MKSRYFSSLLIALVLLGCQKQERVSLVALENPVLKRNTAFKTQEDISLPKFAALKEKYAIDTALRQEADEFKRQLLLRNWIRTVIEISDFEPSYPGKGYAENILDEALKGQGYHCGHYMIVQNAVMNAYGYVTRCLGAGPGVKGGPDGHHGVNEVWSNKFQKWYLSDAKYNHHFEKNGIPLSALEIRDAYLKNNAADIVMVKGIDRTPIETDGVANAEGVMVTKSRADFARTYTWVEYETFNDRYSHWPESSNGTSILTMYEDDFFKNNIWIWDGKPHWAYDETGHLIREPNRDAIEWTPNVLTSDVKIEGDLVHIALESVTPNLRSYQMKKLPHGSWEDVPSSVDMKVDDDTLSLAFRTVNLAGVSGPEHHVSLVKK